MEGIVKEIVVDNELLLSLEVRARSTSAQAVTVTAYVAWGISPATSTFKHKEVEAYGELSTL